MTTPEQMYDYLERDGRLEQSAQNHAVTAHKQPNRLGWIVLYALVAIAALAVVACNGCAPAVPPAPVSFGKTDNHLAKATALNEAAIAELKAGQKK